MSQKKDFKAILTGRILVSIGIILLLVSIFLFYQQQAFIKKASTSTGTIIGIKAQNSTSNRGKRSVMYCPVVKFVDTSGKPIQFKHYICTNPQRLKVGEKVTVLYDPAHPEEAQINSFWSLWLPFGLVLVIGIFCGGMGLLVFKTRK